MGGPLWSPAVGLEDVGSSVNGPYPPLTGDHKGPPLVHPTTLAPTESSIGA
ncbi:MAG: hypothetical protein ACXWPG_05025 [Ktedonobacteraceae bacterium]